MRRRIATVTSDTFRSLSVRNFRLFFVGQGISQIGNWLTLVAQSLLVLKLTDDGVAVGVVTACQFGPILVIGAWAGLVADRSDKRKLLLVVQVFAMAQSFAMAAIAFMDHPPVEAIDAVALLGGIAFAFDNPTRRAFVAEMVPEGMMHNAVSLNTAMMTSARIIGPAVAGLLITTVGYGWCFAVDGCSYVGAILALSLMRASELRVAPITSRAAGQVRAGLRYVRGVPELAIPLVMAAIVGVFTFNFQVVFPLMVTRTFGSGEAMFTVLFSVISIGSLAGALYTAQRRTIDLRDVAVAALSFGVAMLLFAGAPDLAWAFPLGLLVGIGSVMFLTTSTAIVQVNAAPEMRGRVLALQAIVFLGSTPIGGPVIGWIADAAGPRAAVAVGGVAACGAAGWGLLAFRRRRGSLAADEPRPEPDDVQVPEPA
ncbi:MAG TPA: MFS transporter [Acidimicrobiia bacterium]|jgi:MFS family permease